MTSIAEFLIAFFAAATAFATTPFELDSAVQEIERANVTGDVAALERARGKLRVALDSSAETEAEARLLRYTIAYADWRLWSLVAGDRDSKARKAYLEDAERELETLLKQSPDDAEAQALYGTVNGNLITGMWSGMRRGPRVGKALDRALELAPENPRVALQQGVSRLVRPAMAGGSVDEAERELLRALALFEKEDPSRPWPNWGRVEIYGWLGSALVRKGKLAEARGLYEKALALEPGYLWVRQSLLPELEAAEGRR